MMRNRLVLPLPLGPVSCRKDPGVREKLRLLKSLRSPRTHSRLTTSRIVVCPPLRLNVRLDHCIELLGEKHSQRKTQPQKLLRMSVRRVARQTERATVEVCRDWLWKGYKTAKHSPQTHIPPAIDSIWPFAFFQPTQPPFKARTRLKPASKSTCAARMLDSSFGQAQ